MGNTDSLQEPLALHEEYLSLIMDRMQLQRFQNTVATMDESPKVHSYVRGSVSLHGHQYQCLGMYSGVEHMTNVGKVVDFILITSKRKLSPSYHLISLN